MAIQTLEQRQRAKLRKHCSLFNSKISSNYSFRSTIYIMARSLSQPNRLPLLVAQSISLFPLHRRGYAVASDVSVRVGLGNIGRISGIVGSIEDKSVIRDGSEAYSSWAPDPVTGYYRPINHTPEIDPVDLRQMLLNHKFRSPH